MLLGTANANTPSNHPQVDQLVKRYDKNMTIMTCHYANDSRKDWDVQAFELTNANNNHVNRFANFCHFDLMYNQWISDFALKSPMFFAEMVLLRNYELYFKINCSFH